ncbi:MAG: hypothetical protein OEZ43_05675 [Gammaproteobacteria bacterium]|nr:hypothetical protein [Gammaproteobacteria bacterium]
MKIDASKVMTTSSHQSVRRHEFTEIGERTKTLTVPVTNVRTAPKNQLNLLPINPRPAGKTLPPNLRSRHTRIVDTPNVQTDEKPEQIRSASLHSLKTLVEAFFGKPIKLINIDDFQGSTTEAMNDVIESQRGLPGTGDQISGTAQLNSRRIRQESLFEEECSRYNVASSIQTLDGRKIEIDLSLTMSREFKMMRLTEISEEEIRKIVDPLVINLDVNSVSLSQSTFNFDLDANGSTEKLSSLKKGSGFLVLDRNGDRVINDGSEMFGAISGDGFAELRKFDEDSNGFIDEGDSIFSELEIWLKDDSGNDTLIGLAQANIGAISLHASETPFSLNDQQDNAQLGQIRNTAFYLTEDGEAGFIQQVDFLV